MDKSKCPRCENEELRGTENYCPICGLELKKGLAQKTVFLEPTKLRIDKNWISNRIIKNLTNRDKV